IARYLMTDPAYASGFDRVYLWKDFFARKELGGHDTGIDLAAKTKTGEYWAIQCKCYAEDHRVSKDDVDTFISASGRRFRDEDGIERSFAVRCIVATTDEWSEHAHGATGNQAIPVVLIGLNILRDARVDWDAIEKGVHGKSARLEKYELRDHQRDALGKAIGHYGKNDRGRMIMACGTGKTFTSLRIAESFAGGGGNEKRDGCILFLAPSISLIGQTLREWTANAKNELNPICVCSDPKVSKKYSNDDIGERVEDLGAPATTDPQKIVLQYRSSGNTSVVFSTYQSIDSVIEAQKAGLPEFDIIICDEAHRTTGAVIDGADESSFTKVHSNDNIKAKRRLYMTATPRIYGVKGKEDAKKASATLYSMDKIDVEIDGETDGKKIYGDEFYKIGFGKAVELGLLSDYKVLVLTAKETDVPEFIRRQWEGMRGTGKELDIDLECKIWGCMNALAKNIAYDETVRNSDPEPMRSAVAFSRTIAMSREISKKFNEMAKLAARPIDVGVRHIDGAMNAMERDRLMTWLKDDKISCRVLSNVRCLSEGVDVPALDAVMFMNSKGSLIDIVQSVGRVMRKAPGKKYGYIIVPIIVPEGDDPETALDDNERYKLVWQVLRALRSHDERLDAEVNTWNFSKDRKGDHILTARLGGWDGEVPLPIGGQYTLDYFGTALMARLVLKVGDRDYIENWAKGVAEAMPRLMERLHLICGHTDRGYKQYGPAFNGYLKGLRACVNDSVTEDDAVKMLAQQIITKPIFEALFGSDRFVRQNPVSQTIDAMLDTIDAKNGLKDIDLNEFYRSVEATLKQVNTADGKQEVIRTLYEKFFKNAFPKDQTVNGIVYTPMEIVDFILRSAADALREEFGLDIGGTGVNILDPFTGTGTFIARLIESGMISGEDLDRKYGNELFANEITLLAYYIAAVNIENAFRRVADKTEDDEYMPFGNILLTDTFNIEEI
ncbi:MAG: DEAD/DEAH box helicase family protein, partial [Candidatus Methanoplasma sp.]|nr:DEAD/DEAH box helicase family protein [Candidatus Methanoplasma sp.]